MESGFIVIWSLFINTLIRSICSAIHSFLWIDIDFNEYLKIVIYVAIAVISSLTISWFRNGRFIRNILERLYHKTVHNDIFEDVIDKDKKTLMMIFLKSSDVFYLGTFKLKGKNGCDYITLIEYRVMNKFTNAQIRNFTEVKCSVTINLQDIERIEILYEEDSDVWKWLNKNNTLNTEINDNAKETTTEINKEIN